MAARLARFSPAFRAAARSIPRKNRRSVLQQRCMNSPAHDSSNSSSDTPYIIGSALVFGPILFYLISSSGTKTVQHHDSSAKPAAHTPTNEKEMAQKTVSSNMNGDEPDVQTNSSSGFLAANTDNISNAEQEPSAPPTSVSTPDGETTNTDESS